jgi:hypothetical protein
VPGRETRGRSPCCEAIDPGDALRDFLSLARCVVASKHHALAHRQTAREQPHIDEFLSRSSAGDLEDGASSRSVLRFRGRWEPLLDPGDEFGNANPGDGRSEEDGNDVAGRDLRADFVFEEGRAQITAGAIELLDHARVRLSQDIGHWLSPDWACAVARDNLRGTVAHPDSSIHRHQAQLQLAANVFQQRLAARAEAVDLVDENEHWEIGSTNCACETAGLGLHTLD